MTSTCCARRWASSKITYFGYSYGTFLGATYASLFPRTTARWCSTARWTPTTTSTTRCATSVPRRAAFERALGRFFQACAADQQRLPRLRRQDPWDAYDALIDQLNAHPSRCRSRRTRGRSTATTSPPARPSALYARRNWPLLAQALRRRRERRRDALRVAVGQLLRPTPTTARIDPGNDRYFTIGATEQQYPRDIGTYFAAGQRVVGPARALLVEQRLRRAQLRPVAGPRPRRVRRAVQGPELVRHAARRRRPPTTRRRRTAARRASSATWATPGC